MQNKNKNKAKLLFVILAVLALVGLSTSPGVRAGTASPRLELTYAVSSPDQVVIEYTLHAERNVPAGYLPLQCPLSAVELRDPNGKAIPSELKTFCKPTEEGRYLVSHFFSGDFSKNEAVSLWIELGEQSVEASGFGRPYTIKAMGNLQVKPQFQELKQIRFVSDQIVTEGKLGIRSVEMIYTPKNTRVVACLSLPSAEDWIPQVSLLVNDYAYPGESWELLDYKNPAVYAGSERCYRFAIADMSTETKDLQNATIRLRLESLEQNIPECFNPEVWGQIQAEIDFSDLDLKADSAGYVCPMGLLSANHQADPRQVALYSWLKTHLPSYQPQALEVALH